jgi:hypothetical protein
MPVKPAGKSTCPKHVLDSSPICRKICSIDITEIYMKYYRLLAYADNVTYWKIT